MDHVGGAAAGAAAAGACAGGVVSCAGAGAVASGAAGVAGDASGVAGVVASAIKVRAAVLVCCSGGACWPDAGTAMDNPNNDNPRRKHVERAFNLILLSIK